MPQWFYGDAPIGFAALTANANINSGRPTARRLFIARRASHELPCLRVFVLL